MESPSKIQTLDQRAQALNPYGEQPIENALMAANVEAQYDRRNLDFYGYYHRAAHGNKSVIRDLAYVTKQNYREKLDGDVLASQKDSLRLDRLDFPGWLMNLFNADRFGQIAYEDIPKYVMQKFEFAENFVRGSQSERQDLIDAFKEEHERMMIDPVYARTWYNRARLEYINAQQNIVNIVQNLNTLIGAKFENHGVSWVPLNERVLVLLKQDFNLLNGSGGKEIVLGKVNDVDMYQEAVIELPLNMSMKAISTREGKRIKPVFFMPEREEIYHESLHATPPARFEELPDGRIVRYRGFNVIVYDKSGAIDRFYTSTMFTEEGTVKYWEYMESAWYQQKDVSDIIKKSEFLRPTSPDYLRAAKANFEIISNGLGLEDDLEDCWIHSDPQRWYKTIETKLGQQVLSNYLEAVGNKEFQNSSVLNFG